MADLKVSIKPDLIFPERPVWVSRETLLKQQMEADYSKFERPEKSSEPSDWFRSQVKRRLKTGRNIWGGVTGDLGSGKTYWAMRVCEEFDPSFFVDRIVFTSKDFIQTVQNIPPESWVVYDEPGVSMSNRAWMTEANRIATWFLQSSRYRRVNALFCLPALSLMDIAARTILTFQALITDRGAAKVYRIRRNQFSSSPPYFTHGLGTVKTGLPSKRLVEAYETKRREWHESFFKEKKQETPPDISESERILEVVKKRPQDYVSSDGSLSAKKIVARHGCSYQTAYKLKAMVEESERLRKQR